MEVRSFFIGLVLLLLAACNSISSGSTRFYVDSRDSLALQTLNTNELLNADFETNPPTGYGNHIGWPILPWVLGSGQTSNVVEVDGPGGLDWLGNWGPESDASAPGAGIPQHYLDIASGENTFYQTFSPECSGEVNFGGYFSTRANLPGQASVTIREGTGLNGAVVGVTTTVNLPGGNSEIDPWTLVEDSVFLTAGNTYSFIVFMDNNMNFDNGFVESGCPCLEGCTFTQGYWKNHNQYRNNPSQQIPWPIDENTLLCGQTWLDILDTPTGGNAWLNLAHQWIAARLNVANGATTSTLVVDIATVLADAESLLLSCSIATGDIAYALDLKDYLDQYNNGIIGPGHCDDKTASHDESDDDSKPKDKGNRGKSKK